MLNSLSIFLGWRYARAVTKNRFIRFISASSVVGIALGCMVLIVVMSAMNGFERELKDRLLSVVSHIEYRAVKVTGIQDWPSVASLIQHDPRVDAVAPFIKLSGLLQQGENLKPLEIRGIDWRYEDQVSDLSSYVAPEYANAFQQQQGLLLGKGLADSFNLAVGDTVEVLLPQVSKDFKLQAPVMMRLPLIGTFELGGQIDHALGYIPLDLAAKESGWDQGVQGLRLKIQDVFEAPEIARQIGYSLPVYVYLSDWTHQYGHLYSDIQLVRQVMYIILVLVIAVACFNIVSTLVMAVNERAADIAILKTMGASNPTIIQTFMLQGMYNGVVGVVVGCGLGVLIATHLTQIMRFIETLIGKPFLAGDVYFIDFLPSQLQMMDVVLTASIALALAIISTVYPALRATKVDPALTLGGQ